MDNQCLLQDQQSLREHSILCKNKTPINLAKYVMKSDAYIYIKMCFPVAEELS